MSNKIEEILDTETVQDAETVPAEMEQVVPKLGRDLTPQAKEKMAQVEFKRLAATQEMFFETLFTIWQYELWGAFGYNSFEDSVADLTHLNGNAAKHLDFIFGIKGNELIPDLQKKNIPEISEIIKNPELQVVSIDESAFVNVDGENVPLPHYIEDMKAAINKEHKKQLQAANDETKRITRSRDRVQKKLKSTEDDLLETTDKVEILAEKAAVDPELLVSIKKEKEASDYIDRSEVLISTAFQNMKEINQKHRGPDSVKSMRKLLKMLKKGQELLEKEWKFELS